MVQTPKLRGITQGSVFNHARSDDFNQDVLGMVISARCDLAQKKQEKFIYVPLIRAKYWFDFHLIPKLIEESRKTLIGDLKAILVQNKNSDTVIETFGASKCADLLVGLKDHGRYLKKLGELEYVESCIELGKNDKTLFSQKKLASKIDEVISNKIEGFFLIDNIVDYQNNKTELGAYVAILGEPRPLHKVAALGIAEGLDHSTITQNDRAYDSINLLEGEMSYVLCNITSPYIELALQRFSSFYSRVGVENPSSKMKEILVSEAMA
jgi:hypothetical protein